MPWQQKKKVESVRRCNSQPQRYCTSAIIQWNLQRKEVDEISGTQRLEGHRKSLKKQPKPR
jgi:hypothetical protein